MKKGPSVVVVVVYPIDKNANAKNQRGLVLDGSNDPNEIP